MCVRLSVINVLEEKGWYCKQGLEHQSDIEHQHFIGFPI